MKPLCAMMQSPTEANKARFVEVLKRTGLGASLAEACMQQNLALNEPLTREKVKDRDLWL